MFLVRRREEDELFDRLKKCWCSTVKFILQIVIFMHEVITWCLLYNNGVYEESELQISQ